jgi:hypothetical protein
MKKGIICLLVLCVLSLNTLPGIAQSFGSESMNSLKRGRIEFNSTGFAKEGNYRGNQPNLSLPGLSLQSNFKAQEFPDYCKSNIFSETKTSGKKFCIYSLQTQPEMKKSFVNSEWYNKNRRNIYSGLWTYASLNYLYCDLAAFMDADMHRQYHTGTVGGFEMTPGFIAASSAMMQIALSNVFLPHVIKNDRTLRWVQIASGTIMTLVQSATLFADKPSSYYAVFSGFEIAATAYISFDALRWKPQRTGDNY